MVTTLAEDDFSTELSDLAGTAADIGGNYSLSYRTGGGGIIGVDAELYFSGVSGSSGTVFYRLGTGTDGDSHHYVSAIMYDGINGGLWFRGVSSNTFYDLTIPAGSGATTLRRCTSGSFTSLGTITDLGGDTRVHVLVTGSSPTAIKARTFAPSGSEGTTWSLDTTDNTAANQTSAGSFGIFCQRSTAAYFLGNDYLVTDNGGAITGDMLGISMVRRI